MSEEEEEEGVELPGVISEEEEVGSEEEGMSIVESEMDTESVTYGRDTEKYDAQFDMDEEEKQ